MEDRNDGPDYARCLSEVRLQPVSSARKLSEEATHQPKYDFDRRGQNRS